MDHNPHDHLFKNVFGEPDNAMAYFEAILPPELIAALDLPTARLVKGSWVDEELREHHSDLLYLIPFREQEPRKGSPDGLLLYVLWEHQSRVDGQMALKAHRYSTRAIEQWSREHPGQRLPPLIVLVLYHGDAAWTAPLELEELFALDGLGVAAREAIRPLLPKQRYLLEVVPADPRAVRSGRGIGRLTLLALKFGQRAELLSLLLEWMEDFRVEKAKGRLGLHHIGILVQYLLLVNPVSTPENLSEALKPMGSEIQEIPKTYGQRMIEQGRKEGRKEALLQTARKALAKGMSPAEVADLTDLPLEEIQRLAH